MIEARIKFVPTDSSTPIEGVVMDKVRMGDHDCYVVREVSEEFEKDTKVFIVSPYAIRSIKTYGARWSRRTKYR